MTKQEQGVLEKVTQILEEIRGIAGIYGRSTYESLAEQALAYLDALNDLKKEE